MLPVSVDLPLRLVLLVQLRLVLEGRGFRVIVMTACCHVSVVVVVEMRFGIRARLLVVLLIIVTLLVIGIICLLFTGSSLETFRVGCIALVVREVLLVQLVLGFDVAFVLCLLFCLVEAKHAS